MRRPFGTACRGGGGEGSGTVIFLTDVRSSEYSLSSWYDSDRANYTTSKL